MTQKSGKKNRSIAPKELFSDPMKNLGPASSQLPAKIPVAKIEYLANAQVKQEFPHWQKGKFSINIGEQLDFLQAALIGMRYGRILWPDGYDPKNPDQEPLCKSENGLFPDGGTDCPKSDSFCVLNGEKQACCVHVDAHGNPTIDISGRYVPACDYAKWGAQKQAPKCKEFFVLLLYEHQLNIPLIYTIKSTGIKHLSRLRMDLYKFQREARFDIKWPVTVYAKIHITPLPVQNWYEPSFSVLGKFQKTEIDINIEALKNLRPNLDNMKTEDFMYENDNPDCPHV